MASRWTSPGKNRHAGGDARYRKAVRLLYDIFPARLVLDGVSRRNARVLVRDDKTVAIWDEYTESKLVDPYLVGVWHDVTIIADDHNRKAVTLIMGDQTVDVVKRGSCGCGSRLRRLRAMESIPA